MDFKRNPLQFLHYADVHIHTQMDWVSCLYWGKAMWGEYLSEMRGLLLPVKDENDVG
jgi:hypothetical protein